MSGKVRSAIPEDSPEISAVHRSTIERWTRTLPNGVRVECRPEELSPFERFLLGGPWMDPESCGEHLRRVLATGQRPIVAVDDDGRVQGELELVIGPDPPRGRTGHIDVMAVHREAQRSGLGRTLVREARRIALEAGCEVLTTNPEADAVGFYERCGLRTVLARQQEVRLPAAREGADAARAQPDPPGEEFGPWERLELRVGRFQTSYATWIKGLWTVPGLTDQLRRDEGRIPDLGARYRLWQHALRPKTASAYAWTEPASKETPRILRILADRAGALGYDELRTTVDMSDLEACNALVGAVGEESMILGDGLGSQARSDLPRPARPADRAESC